MVLGCFSVYWVDVMFRLTGWNKVDEILCLVFDVSQCSWWLCSAIFWFNRTRRNDITKAFYSKAHTVQKNCERLQTWTAHRSEALRTSLQSKAQKQHIGKITTSWDNYILYHHQKEIPESFRHKTWGHSWTAVTLSCDKAGSNAKKIKHRQFNSNCDFKM